MEFRIARLFKGYMKWRLARAYCIFSELRKPTDRAIGDAGVAQGTAPPGSGQTLAG